MRALLYAILLVLVGTGHAEHGEMKNCSMGFESMQSTEHGYACYRCMPGYYKNTFGTERCTVCPLGTYANTFLIGTVGNEINNCLLCGENTFQDEERKTSCKACAVGKFFDGTGASACDVCPPGQEGSDTGGCQECGVGTYKNSTEHLECLPCDGVGTYQDKQGAITCLPCPPGQYQNTPGATECILCSIGNYSQITGASACVECPAGRYQDKQGATTCFPCPPGEYQNTPGATECIPCSIGKHSMQARGRPPACVKCPAGTYANNTGMQECLVCPRGSFAPVPGASSCSTDLNPPSDTCQHPMICNNVRSGMVYCYLQPVSKCGLEAACSNHATRANTNMCSGVDQHPFFQNAYNMPVSDEEWRSIWPAAGPNSVSCHLQCTHLHGPRQDFTRLYHITEAGSECCFMRLVSEVSNATGSVIPEPTQEQIYQDRCSSFSAQCAITCGENQAANSSGVCELCARGTFKSGNGTEPCAPCVAGKFWQSLSYTPYAVCVECPRHKYRSDGNPFACLPCPNGTYANRTGAKECATCGAGLYVPVGETACIPCAEHTYKPGNDTDPCLPCPNGMYANRTGAKECVACAVGKFRLAGARECSPCPNGTFGPDEGRATCVSCPQHSTTAGPGATSVTECECNADAIRSPLSAQCTQCAQGTSIIIRTFLRNASAICAVNHADNLQFILSRAVSLPLRNTLMEKASTHEAWVQEVTANFRTLCDSEPKCEGFSYVSQEMPDGRQTYCFYMTDPNVNASRWTPFPFLGTNGLWNIREKRCYWKDKRCESCPVGSYNTNTGDGCDMCPYGTFSDTPGATACTLCHEDLNEGYTSPRGSISQAACTGCGVGFRIDYDTRECIPCPPGEYESHTRVRGNRMSCRRCPSGKTSVAQSISLENCTACPVGKYAWGPYLEGYGAPECAPCPAGTFNEESGSERCSACAPGKFATNATFELAGGGACPAATGVVSYVFARGVERGQCEAACRALTACSSYTLATTPWNNPALCYLHLTKASLAGGDTAAIREHGAFLQAPSAQHIRLQDVNESALLLWCFTRAWRPTCQPCAPGTFQDTPGMSECAACPKGTYSAAWNASRCVACPTNSSTREAGAHSVAQCVCRSGYGRTNVSAGFEGACTPCPSGSAHAHDGPEAFEFMGEGECRGPPRYVSLVSTYGTAQDRTTYNSTEPSPVFHAARTNMSEAQCAALCALQTPCIGYAYGSLRPSGAARCIVYLPEPLRETDETPYYRGWEKSGDTNGRTLATSITTASGGWSLRCMRKDPTALNQREFADEAYEREKDLYSIPTILNEDYCSGKMVGYYYYEEQTERNYRKFVLCERTFLCLGYVNAETDSSRFHLLFEDKTKTYSAGSYPASSGCVERKAWNPWACRRCQRGSSALNAGAARCDACSVGTYQDERGKTSCRACPISNQETQGPGAVVAGACQCKPGYAGADCASCYVAQMYDPGRSPRTYTQYRASECATAPGRRRHNVTRAACEHACSRLEHCKAYEHDAASDTCTLHGTYIDEGLRKWTPEDVGEHAWRGVRADPFSGSTWRGAPSTPNISCYALDPEPTRVCRTCPHQIIAIMPEHSASLPGSTSTGACVLEYNFDAPLTGQAWLDAVANMTYFSHTLRAENVLADGKESLRAAPGAWLNLSVDVPQQYTCCNITTGAGAIDNAPAVTPVFFVVDGAVQANFTPPEPYAQARFVVCGLQQDTVLVVATLNATLHARINVVFYRHGEWPQVASGMHVLPPPRHGNASIYDHGFFRDVWNLHHTPAIFVVHELLHGVFHTFYTGLVQHVQHATPHACGAQLCLWVLDAAHGMLLRLRNMPSGHTLADVKAPVSGLARGHVLGLSPDPTHTFVAVATSAATALVDLASNRTLPVRNFSVVHKPLIVLSNTVFLAQHASTEPWHLYRLEEYEYIFACKMPVLRAPCRQGSFLAGGDCQPCANGFFKGWRGDEACVLCAHEYHTTASIGAVSADACVCRAGAQPAQDGCELCTQTQFSVAGGQCQQCPQGAKSDGVRCECPQQEFFDPETAKCQVCPYASYKPNTGTEYCTGCGAHMYTDYNRQRNATDCLCVPGYGLHAETPKCAACPPGTFALGGAHAPCQSCAPGTYNEHQRATACVTCPDGMYTPTAAARACRMCPAGMVAHANRTVCVPSGVQACAYAPDLEHLGAQAFVDAVRDDFSRRTLQELTHSPGGIPESNA